MTRCIALLDLDAFYAAVEVLERPELAGKPVIVGAPPDRRGVVTTASYEARKFGVRSAMPMRTAVRLCPDGVFLQPNFPLYRRYSRRVMDTVRRLASQVEQVSVDEAYVDLTEPASGDFDRGVEIAREMQRDVKERVGLDCSLGVATSKMVAKIACGQGKPHGFTVVRPGEEAAFLAPLPVEEAPGIGPVTGSELRRAGIRTLGELAAQDEQEMERRFGRRGRWMREAALGIDESPVVTEREVKSISGETTFEIDTADEGFLRRAIWKLSGEVARRLEQKEMRARTVGIKLRYHNFATITRARTLAHAVASADDVGHQALALFEAHWERGRPVRLVGVKAEGLLPASGDASTEAGARPEQPRLL